MWSFQTLAAIWSLSAWKGTCPTRKFFAQLNAKILPGTVPRILCRCATFKAAESIFLPMICWSICILYNITNLLSIEMRCHTVSLLIQGLLPILSCHTGNQNKWMNVNSDAKYKLQVDEEQLNKCVFCWSIHLEKKST